MTDLSKEALDARALERVACGVEAKIGQHVHSRSLAAHLLRDLAKNIRALDPAQIVKDMGE